MDNYETYENEEYCEVDGLGNYYREIDKMSLLSEEEEIELAKKIQEGDKEALERFIEANLRLVRYVASKYKGNGVSEDDLIGEGNLALIQAVKKFNPDKGHRFSSYAVECIDGVLKNAIGAHGLIRKTQHVFYDISKYNHAEERLAKELNHTPSKYEMSKAFGISEKTIDRIKMLSQKPISISSPINEDDDLTLGDSISDSSVNVETEVLSKISKEGLIKLIKESGLNKQEKVVLYYLCGLDGNEPRNQTEVANIMNITRARVSQIVMDLADKIHIEGDEISIVNKPRKSKKSHDEYILDDRTKKLLKSVRKTLNKETYKELESAIIKAKQDERFNSLSSTELIILLLSFGLINNKCYAPIEISNILCLDYNSIAPIINNTITKYKNIFDEFDCDKGMSR